MTSWREAPSAETSAVNASSSSGSVRTVSAISQWYHSGISRSSAGDRGSARYDRPASDGHNGRSAERYGIKYDANFQQRIDSPRNDGEERVEEVLTIKAFNDTWALGVHSYLSHVHERLYLCRELLSESGSVFVQISDTNVHLVRAVMDEVFGKSNFVSMINFTKTTSQSSELLSSVSDYLLWYGKNKEATKYHALFFPKEQGQAGAEHYDLVELPGGERRRISTQEAGDPSLLPPGSRLFTPDNACSSRLPSGCARQTLDVLRCFNPQHPSRPEKVPSAPGNSRSRLQSRSLGRRIELVRPLWGIEDSPPAGEGHPQ